MRRICLFCGETFLETKENDFYCSTECEQEHAKQKAQEYYLKNKTNIKNTSKNIETAICVTCGKEFIKNAHNQKCCSKECSKEYTNKLSLQYYYKNKEKKLSYGKKYRIEHKTIKKAICQVCGKEFIKKTNNKYCSIECRKEHDKQLKYEYNKKYLSNKYKNNIEFKLKVIFRTNFRRCLDFIGTKNKEYSTFEIFGYTPNQLKQRLESQFKNGMNWDNIGTYWEIHHKKPLYQFNFKDKDNKIDYHQIFLANCLANLQPLTIEEHNKTFKKK